MADDPEIMDPGQGGEQAQEAEDTELKEIFDREIVRDRNRRRTRILRAGLVSFVLVMAFCGMFLVSLPRSAPVPESLPPQGTPLPEIIQPAFTPFPDTAQQTSADQVSTTGLPGAINGKANPGFPFWPSGTIPYRFDPAHPCSVGKTADFLRAFKIINDKTDGLVSFMKSPDGSLVIGCHDSPGAMGASGWSNPWFSPSGSISNATIDMYRLPQGTYECDAYPTLEIHEILHVLGFENIASPGNVMYSETAEGSPNPCGELDAGIVNCLKNIYSNGKKGQSCSGIPHK